MTPYDQRPWLALRPAGAPADIDLEHRDVVSAFRATVARVPDRDALRYGGGVLSFAELDAASDALAAALQDAGLARGDRAAVQLQNMPQFPLVCLAVWKLGAIVVSVNPMYRGEVRELLVDSGAVLLVTLEDLWRDVSRAIVPETAVRTVVTTSPLDFAGGAPPPMAAGVPRDRDPDVLDLATLVADHAGHAPDHAAAPSGDDLATLAYTSGTTGPPKGAASTHANVMFSATAYTRFFGVDGPDEVVLGFAPFFHVTGLVGLMVGWLRTGATIVLPYRFDPREALALVERHRVTWTVGVVTAFIAMLDAAGEDPPDLSSLRVALSGGAPIPPPVVEEFRRRLGSTIVPGYGMTESTMVSHGVPADRTPPVDPASGLLSIGIPMFQVGAQVVGDDGRPVPAGEPGELLICGPGIATGYWRRPEETEATFGGGWLRTGDIGFMDPEGWFFLLDRKKDVIIASGYKIWPREVEEALYAHPAVREAVVVGVPDPYRGETVKAFVSLKAGASADAATLVAHCRDALAAYKAPRAVEIRDDLPKTATGKLLRRALR